MSEYNKPSFYGVLPAHIRYNKNLPPMARLVYSEISALCNKNGFCNAKNSTIASNFDIDQRSVSRYISQMADLNLIWISSVTTPIGTMRRIFVEKNIYDQIGGGVTKLSIPPRQNCLSPHDKIVAQNNTSINNKEKEKDENIDFNKKLSEIEMKIAQYLASEMGKIQIESIVQRAMFKGDVKQAIKDFILYWYAQDDKGFENSPVRFLNKKLVFWLKKSKTMQQKQKKAPNNTNTQQFVKPDIKDYVQKVYNDHLGWKHYYKKYFENKLNDYAKFKPTIKQAAFEFDVLHGKALSDFSPEMRMKSFKNFMQEVTTSAKKFSTDVDLFKRFKIYMR